MSDLRNALQNLLNVITEDMGGDYLICREAANTIADAEKALAEHSTTWTVILYYPDYLQDDDQLRTYIATVPVDSMEVAIQRAKQMAAETAAEEDDDGIDPDDFAVVWCLEGSHILHR